jgi:hypothetical protein
MLPTEKKIILSEARYAKFERILHRNFNLLPNEMKEAPEE